MSAIPVTVYKVGILKQSKITSGDHSLGVYLVIIHSQGGYSLTGTGIHSHWGGYGPLTGWVSGDHSQGGYLVRYIGTQLLIYWVDVI